MGKKEQGSLLLERIKQHCMHDRDFFTVMRTYIDATPAGRKALALAAPALVRVGAEIDRETRDDLRRLTRGRDLDDLD